MTRLAKMVGTSWRWLVGENGSARQILHHGFLVSAVFIGLFSAVFNYLMKLTVPAYSVALAVISLMVMVMWYRSRFHGEFSRMSWLFCTLVTFVMLPGNWVFNHGASGPTLLFYLMAAAYVLGVLPPDRLRRGVIISGLMLMPWILLWGEMANPQLVSSYASTAMRSLDMGVSYTLAFGLLSLVIAGYAKRIREERDLARAYAKKLERLSRLDSLTGLYNHRTIHEHAEHHLSGRDISCLLICDLDHFKQINDAHGHPYGDQVLAHFSMHIQTLSREYSGKAGRYGGEEFMILLPGNLAVAREFDRQLRESCEASPLAHGVIRFSTGVSERRHPDTLSSWVQRSDEALYHAKASGRDQLIVDHDISMV
ncbi:GGDEF domain-containing protein [Cobetia sp. MMG027]|uniref:GGDEF domain-containing protein n=1 Tax=Cobetia sp. MMG027 TaxID=3021980 RepID=UPI0022FE1185|nr:GGDEF domain-containing protein [Cobetia sp. MMG027]MDA5563267.1 GGDEF domain-containing protein [Cobetia sp. MMG027]